MLINLSNHPSTSWSAEQTETANRLFGKIVDLPFPDLDPAGDEAYIEALSDEYFLKVIEMSEGKDVTVHLMGEMNFTFSLVNKLKSIGITCVASTTERETIEENGVKKSIFKFVNFRRYE